MSNLIRRLTDQEILHVHGGSKPKPEDRNEQTQEQQVQPEHSIEPGGGYSPGGSGFEWGSGDIYWNCCEEFGLGIDAFSITIEAADPPYEGVEAGDVNPTAGYR